MPRIRYQDRWFDLLPGETVLDGLLRAGIEAPHSCRIGACQTCLMEATEGLPPASAQRGLTLIAAAQGRFLACICNPEADLAVRYPAEARQRFAAEVIDVRRYGDAIAVVRLTRPYAFNYRAGQFTQVYAPDGDSRSYSLASVPERDNFLELHIKHLAGGVMSGWIWAAWQPGLAVEIGEARGECCYLAGEPDRPLMMIGTGTGLAPLYGVLREALGAGHAGPLLLFHGSSRHEGIYLREALQKLAADYPNFQYTACLSGERVDGYAYGRAHSIAFAAQPQLKGWRVYLCGHPEMVDEAKRRAFLAGASFRDIHADPFVFRSFKS